MKKLFLILISISAIAVMSCSNYDNNPWGYVDADGDGVADGSETGYYNSTEVNIGIEAGTVSEFKENFLQCVEYVEDSCKNENYECVEEMVEYCIEDYDDYIDDLCDEEDVCQPEVVINCVENILDDEDENADFFEALEDCEDADYENNDNDEDEK
ncbi:MAG: hypothetical protein ABIA04_11145 [Pseudomonadota bacterium]